MLVLINPNRMRPPIAPVGLDYVAGFLRGAGVETDVVDLCLADDAEGLLVEYFASHRPVLVGLSFRNVDDCFWPSAGWFVEDLAAMVKKVRAITDAAIVLGGVGYSIFPERILEYTGADFGVRGDGERVLLELYESLAGGGDWRDIAGLVYRDGDEIRGNRPVWGEGISLPISRDAVDNVTYFARGGQVGIETKRGCDRRCIYCVEHLAKGRMLRLRSAAEVADEVEVLLGRGIDVLHLCDSEFNIPYEHAMGVCGELIGRGLGEKVRWYVYMTVTPFDDSLAMAMRRAGCVGINFTGDSANRGMLATYRQPHSAEDLAGAVRVCRDNGITVMFDLMLGGPGETPETVAETIGFAKEIGPDAVGTALGIRIYPGTEIAKIVTDEGNMEKNPNIRRRYEGPVDLFLPTFYISSQLGERPATLVRELIDGDRRFFEPMPDIGTEAANSTDHNYNDNTELVEAIAKGARGAYWDILRKLKS